MALEIFKLVGSIFVDTDQASRSIQKVDKNVEGVGKTLISGVGTIAKWGTAVIATAGAVSTAAAAAVGALTKSAVENYAEYEQLVGGIETLFGAGGQAIEEYAKSVGKSVEECSEEYEKLMLAQDTMMAQAKSAYKSAGMSMNEYMDTATSFAAALTSSCQSTLEAAEMTDLAISDMSDNANKMGTSMESIKNAYQGFAKQNYTMLDNLKLGYGGTKSEMERLIEDANRLREAQGLNADLTIENYSDVISAIHEVQVEMGIYGTTAKEAATTINGSIGMMKASWKNFLTGMADGKQDFRTLANELVDSAITVVNNVVPRFIETVPRVVKGLEEIVANITPKIVPLINDLLPPLLTGAANLIVEVSRNIPDFLSTLAVALRTSMGSLMDNVLGIFAPSVKENFEKAFTFDFAKYIEDGANRLQKIWDSMIQPIIDFAMEYYNFFKENLDTVFSLYADEFGIMSEFIDLYWTTTVEPILDALKRMLESTFNLVLENMPFMLEQTRKAMDGIKDCWDKIQPAMLTFTKTLQEQVLPAIILVFEKILLPVAEKTIVWLAVFISETLIPTFAGLCEFLSGVFTGDFEMALNGIFEMSNVVLGDILNLFITIFNQAAENVKTSIEKIKSFLDFEWSLPELKMPHFKMDGEFSLTPPSVPTISVDWYKKAMDNPIIMDKPTAFGINSDGQIMAGGEAGREIVSGANTLMSMISEATAKNNQEMLSALYLILQELKEMNEELPERLRDAIDDMALKISNREFARLVKAVN